MAVIRTAASFRSGTVEKSGLYAPFATTTVVFPLRATCALVVNWSGIDDAGFEKTIGNDEPSHWAPPSDDVESLYVIASCAPGPVPSAYNTPLLAVRSATQGSAPNETCVQVTPSCVAYNSWGSFPVGDGDDPGAVDNAYVTPSDVVKCPRSYDTVPSTVFHARSGVVAA